MNSSKGTMSETVHSNVRVHIGSLLTKEDIWRTRLSQIHSVRA
jgi:hypothetical protein